MELCALTQLSRDSKGWGSFAVYEDVAAVVNPCHQRFLHPVQTKSALVNVVHQIAVCLPSIGISETMCAHPILMVVSLDLLPSACFVPSPQLTYIFTRTLSCCMEPDRLLTDAAVKGGLAGTHLTLATVRLSELTLSPVKDTLGTCLCLGD